MGLLSETGKQLGRMRYAAAQGTRSAWYGAHHLLARRRSGAFTRPGEAPFQPASGTFDARAMRQGFLDLFARDRSNIEAGLYRAPNDVRLRDLARTLASSRAFLKDVPEVDRRRTERSGTEVRQTKKDRVGRFPVYYRQNFHYQSDGWLSDDSARVYDTQVETLFAGAADAMRRAALAELAKALAGRDQREVSYLDVACGTGRFLGQVLRNFPKLNASGLDLSPNYADRAERTTHHWPQVDIIEGAAEAMPVADESVDLLSAIYLFHELPPRVRPLVFAEIARVLKPGGVVIFAASLQFGDVAALDAALEYFPEGFHEPYYKGYLKADLVSQIEAAGLVSGDTQIAFLTKVMTFTKRA